MYKSENNLNTQISNQVPWTNFDRSFSLFDWSSKIKDLMAINHLSSSELMRALLEHPILKECYEKNSGVSEGYTVGEHTQMVLDVALKYRESFQDQIEQQVSWSEFLLFLGLHDIGKGVAKENEEIVFTTAISFKERELTTTRKIMQEVMDEVGISSDKILLFSEMLSYDTLGLYLRGHIDEDEAIDNILEMARDSGRNPHLFYQIFQIFHMIDAASYPALMRSIFNEKGGKLYHVDENWAKIDLLNQKIRTTEEGETIFKTLLEKMAQGPLKEVKREFLENLPKLRCFLEKMHKGMLSLSQPYEKEKLIYRRVKNGFRDLFFYFAKSSDDLPKLKSLYDTFLRDSLGNRQFNQITIQATNLESLLFGDGYNKMEVQALFDELTLFRKNYLCRFSLSKIQDQIKQVEGISENALTLLAITFLHGTNATILANLLKTGLQLMPSGRLFKSGIVPFSGELEGGSTALGINQYQISGTSLDDGYRAIRYAKDTSFQADLTEEENQIKAFLEEIKGKLESRNGCIFLNPFHTTASDWWTRVSVAILRMRALDPEAFDKLKIELKDAITHAEESYTQFQESESYKKHMPKEEDPDRSLGYGWHDYYWWRHFKNTENAIASLKNAVDREIVIPEGIREIIKNPYPLVFGSKTLHTFTPDLQSPSERCARKASLLGKDIQMIFVDPENFQLIQKFLEEQGLKSQVSLLPMEELMIAITLNKLVSPFFADIISQKKLARIS